MEGIGVESVGCGTANHGHGRRFSVNVFIAS
jgi:hypothetical protein